MPDNKYFITSQLGRVRLAALIHYVSLRKFAIKPLPNSQPFEIRRLIRHSITNATGKLAPRVHFTVISVVTCKIARGLGRLVCKRETLLHVVSELDYRRNQLPWARTICQGKNRGPARAAVAAERPPQLRRINDSAMLWWAKMRSVFIYRPPGAALPFARWTITSTHFCCNLCG